jgi:hypothetical protein
MRDNIFIPLFVATFMALVLGVISAYANYSKLEQKYKKLQEVCSETR